MDEIEQLNTTIAALEGQRAVLGDAVVDTAVAPLRARLAELAGQADLEGRKRVTILFADLVGFTSMSEKIDPEDVQEILRRYFARWTEYIEQYGGAIDKYIGDAVMAVFGLPAAHEDDPERAIQAALAMQAALDEINTSCQADFNATLAMRVGIHTGLVVVSRAQESAGKEFDVLGDAVNLASRLQTNAPVNAILISQDVYRSVKGLFDLQSLGEIQVKGRQDPVKVYVVQRAKPRAFRAEPRGVEGVETPLVGRDAEFECLQRIFGEMLEGQARLVAITGEAGVGKSRLAAEFQEWLDLYPERIWLFKGRAGSATRQAPFFVLRDLIAFRFEILENDSQEGVRRKLEAGMAQFVEADAALKAHFLGAWLGFEIADSPYLAGVRGDPQQLRERAMNYLVEFFSAACRRAPAVLLLDDIHWADDQSLEVMLALRRRCPDLRLLIVCTARPALFELHPEWASPGAECRVIALETLPPEHSRRLIEAILHRVPDIPDRLVEMIVARSEGNPFFVEELIKMLIEAGVIDASTAPWQVDVARLGDLQVPPSLTEVLQARLDNLPLQGKAALQRAAVVGRIFWELAVAELMRQGLAEPGRDLSTALDLLHAREMIFARERSAFEGTREFMFKHALLRDVTYENILKRERRAYHARVARWLEDMAQRNGRAEEFAALIGEHYANAGEKELASAWLQRAGVLAAAQSAYPDAARLLTQALELLDGAHPERQAAILFERESAQRATGRRPEQLQDLESLERLIAAETERAGGSALPDWLASARPELHLRWSYYCDVTGEYAAVIEHARTAAELAAADGLVEHEARAFTFWGVGLWRMAEYERSMEKLDDALQRARQAGLALIEADCLRQLGAVADTRGDYQPARRYFEQALQIFRWEGALRGVARCLNSLGAVALHLAEFEHAKAYMLESLPLYRQIGERYGEGVVLTNLAQVYHALGDWNAYSDCFRQALALCREIEDAEGEETALNGLGTAMLEVGQWRQAQEYFEQGLEICQRIGDRHGESGMLSGIGQLYAARGDDVRALELAQKALAIAREIQTAHEAGYALVYIGQALTRLGRFDAALQSFYEALELRQNQEPLAMDCLAGIAEAQLHAGNLSAALAQVETVLNYLERNGVTGLENPVQLFWSCCRVLRAAGDRRAVALQARAVALIQTRSAALADDAIRRSYLENIPVNRAVLAEE